MISFLGICIENFIQSIKYIIKKNLKFETVLNQAVMISVESLPIALTIVIIAAAVIALQVSKQFLMSGGEGYVGGGIFVFAEK